MKKFLMVVLMWSGSFGASLAMAEDCLPCDGKINNAIVRYDGDEMAFVQVIGRKGGVMFASRVSPYTSFALVGANNLYDKKATLGPAISVYVNGNLNAEFHTSCSEPFGPGTASGDFVVLSATSRNNGLTCAVDRIPDVPGNN